MLIALLSRVVLIIVLIFCALSFASVTAQISMGSGSSAFSNFTNLFVRKDSYWYLDIAQHGYPLGLPKYTTIDAGRYFIPLAYPQWAYFPFYPAMIRALASLVVGFNDVNASSLIVSGIMISNIAFFISIYYFYKLTTKLFNSKIALISITFYSFWIATVFLSAVYTEALFMALALGSFYYLEEKRYYVAATLAILAVLTRSDGFLIAIPFFIYSLQIKIPKIYEKCKCGCGKLVEARRNFIKSHLKNIEILLVSAVVVSTYLIWNLVGYFLTNRVFPIQELAYHSNWGAYPPLINQFSYWQLPLTQCEFVITALVFIIAMPTIYFLVKIKKIFAEESSTLKYWIFYASIAYVLFTQSLIFSVIRYAIPMLPIYWVFAKIYCKNRVVGFILLIFMIILAIIGVYLFEIQSFWD